MSSSEEPVVIEETGSVEKETEQDNEKESETNSGFSTSTIYIMILSALVALVILYLLIRRFSGVNTFFCSEPTTSNTTSTNVAPKMNSSRLQ